MTRGETARLICALGVAQIISWGTLFYSVAVLGESMRRDLAIDDAWLFGAFTFGLICSGIASPLAGRWIDRRGGSAVLSAGSLVGAVSLLVLAQAHGLGLLFLGWALAGVAMAACLYDPAFATLHQLTGSSYRRAVTALTLFGGFASTVFWPLSQLLLDSVGWRAALQIYALLHLFVCLPLHLWLVPRPASLLDPKAVDADSPGEAIAPPNRSTFVLLATALSIAAFIAAALSAHLIALFKANGIDARQAVWIASLIGPMQVAGRIVELAFTRHVRPLAVGTLAFALMALAMGLLTQAGAAIAVAWLFAAVYGWSNGIMTIVRGTVPAELFGRRGYGALLGRLALPAFVSKAFAPLAFSLVLSGGMPRQTAAFVLMALALLAFAAYQLSIRPGRGP